MNNTTPQRPTETPWGVAQDHCVVAPGIDSYSTAGHGGLRLSSERWRELKRRFPTYAEQYAPAPWLEEDCDWAFAAVSFPECFTQRNVVMACQTIRASYNGRHTTELETNCQAALAKLGAAVARIGGGSMNRVGIFQKPLDSTSDLHDNQTT